MATYLDVTERKHNCKHALKDIGLKLEEARSIHPSPSSVDVITLFQH